MCVLPLAEGHRRAGALLALTVGVAAVLGGCATPSPAPPNWQRSAKDFQTTPFGTWANVTLKTGRVISGELIAADDQSIHLGANLRLMSLPGRCVSSMRLAMFEADNSGVTTWGVAGTLSTLTHGFILGISAPVWLATTITFSTLAGRAGYQTLAFDRGVLLRSAGTWARFPPGLPAGFAERARERDTLDAACDSVAIAPPAPPPPPETPAAVPGPPPDMPLPMPEAP